MPTRELGLYIKQPFWGPLSGQRNILEMLDIDFLA